MMAAETEQGLTRLTVRILDHTESNFQFAFVDVQPHSSSSPHHETQRVEGRSTIHTKR